jgi:2'-5' RNA ligase
MESLTISVTETRDHWWWRPGWRLGRSFYAWHVTFAEQPMVGEVAEIYAAVLDRLPMVDRIPVRWLHLTMQGLGFTDEVDRSDVDRIVTAARARCAALQPFSVTLGPVRVDSEALKLPARPVGPLNELRSTVRGAIGEVWGNDYVPEAREGWRPHVSLAYMNAAGPAEPIVQALAAIPAQTTEIEVSAVSLINLSRDHKMYEWSDVATVLLGQ